jgi:L-threonylcarbamoyladenylate synthase
LTPRNLEPLSRRAIDLMGEGGLVVYPTDTVYGLGADATNGRALRAVYRAKGRTWEKAISVAVADLPSLEEIADLSGSTRAILAEILPGPYTAILPSNGALSQLERDGKIGVRIPDHRLAPRLTRLFPVTCTSANLAGERSPTSAGEVTVEADLLIDGGPSPIGVHSTVIDLVQRPPRILREGSGDVDGLRRLLMRSGSSGLGG